jgi:hypothetical protein
MQIDKKIYYITFIDNCNIYCYTYLLRNKYETFWFFKHYQNKIKNQPNKKIKLIISDRYEEYEVHFSEFFFF